MIIAGTGHRPDKLGGYGDLAFKLLVKVSMRSIEKFQPKKIISGMALGWDQALAQAAHELHVPFISAIPFQGYEIKWPAKSQRYYNKLLALASKVVYVSSPGYLPNKMQIRNIWMVDHSTDILACWNKDESGGTWNCIKYARSVGKPIHNVYNKLIKLQTR